jgi:hypothetical protein
LSDRPSYERLSRKTNHGFQAHSVATVAWHGPDAYRATKVAVGIQRWERGDFVAMDKSCSHTADVRQEAEIAAAIPRDIGSRAPAVWSSETGCSVTRTTRAPTVRPIRPAPRGHIGPGEGALCESVGGPTVAYNVSKTEHAGAKKASGMTYGRQAVAKAQSNRRCREDGNVAIRRERDDRK